MKNGRDSAQTTSRTVYCVELGCPGASEDASVALGTS